MADQKDFSKIRHEVYKFGLEGLDKKDQVNARYEQAIKLGAKPKSWIKPHKNLGEQRQQQQQESQTDQHHNPQHLDHQPIQSRPRKQVKRKQEAKKQKRKQSHPKKLKLN